MEKIWKSVQGFEGYEVSEYGDVRRGSMLLKPELTHGNGRKRFSLSRGGRVFRNGGAKLTEADVLAIRAASGTSRDIGTIFGINGSTVLRIKARKKWAHI